MKPFYNMEPTIPNDNIPYHTAPNHSTPFYDIMIVVVMFCR